MASSPRCHAELLLEKLRFYGLIPDGSLTNAQLRVFIDTTEQAFRSMLADELRWLADYLNERAKREGGEPDAGTDEGQAVAVTRPRRR